MSARLCTRSTTNESESAFRVPARSLETDLKLSYAMYDNFGTPNVVNKIILETVMKGQCIA